MDNKEKDIGLDFCDTLHKVLLFAMEQCYDKDWSETKEMAFTIPECFDLMATEVLPIYKLSEYYEDLIPNWVGFALTKDIKYFDVEYEDSSLLVGMKRKIEKELSKYEERKKKVKASNDEFDKLYDKQDLYRKLDKLRFELDWNRDKSLDGVRFSIDTKEDVLELDDIYVEIVEDDDGKKFKHIGLITFGESDDG